VSDETALDRIVARTARENARRRSKPALAIDSTARDGLPALRRTGEIRLIAEIKFKTPRAGVLRERRPGEVARIARAYADAGAACVSVLADTVDFGGTPLDVRRAAKATEVPVLFKGFVLDEVQIELAKACSAALVLIIARIVTPDRLRALVDHALGIGIEPLVEAADEREIDLAHETGARAIGVNARDLRTFDVDLERGRALSERIERTRVAVLMSGVRTRADVVDAEATRADALLVGETLMRAPEPGVMLARLRLP
jgi:indole-3-glycerol phosphate synthase